MTARPALAPWLARALPAAAALTVFVGLSGLWLAGEHETYLAFFQRLGLSAFRFPFLDSHAVLAAVECHRLGLDVYAINPCDALGRLHVYSPLWLHLGVLPVTTAWTGPVGLTLDVLFLGSLVTLPPARRPLGLLMILLATVSPAVAYALERANNDVLIFLLAVLTGHLAAGQRWLRACAYGLIVLAAGLKFYPATLLVLTCRERWRHGLIVVIVTLIALAVCLLPEQSSLLRALHLMPAGEADTFGASNVPSAFVRALHWPDWTRGPVQGVLLTVMATKALHWSGRSRLGLRRLPTLVHVFLTIGSVMIVGCFLTGQNAGYRAIHLLLILPALLRLAADRRDHLARAAAGLTVVVMWGAGLPLHEGYGWRLLWVANQYAWWIEATMLLSLLLAILRDSTALRSWLAARIPPASTKRQHRTKVFPEPRQDRMRRLPAERGS